MFDALEAGYVIKDRRAELGLTQAQLAKAAGVSERCLWSLELGRSKGVQLDKLLAVFAVLGLDLAVIEQTNGSSITQISKSEKLKLCANGNTDTGNNTGDNANPNPSIHAKSGIGTEGVGRSGAPSAFDPVAILAGGTR